ncbi:hypothetical protein [Nesterenkonia flava]|uniref:Uncharacterized protein n=1 Tax=Nesterenkonia flava TaxID=469799 RepID=A0ABU1FRA7_9MICC|nr:hypothetical protein [Nesterenkonia flava]MDR5711192.1 hypothetical protein [Nesterenkonia flava]
MAEAEKLDPEWDEALKDMEIELEIILRDAEATVTEIRKELAEQRLRRRQHEQIDKLPEYLATTRGRWRDLKALFTEVLEELRSGDGERDSRT